MKKKKKENHILRSAYSRDNGIAFDSVECPFLQVDSSVNEKGEIEAVVIPKSVGIAREIAEIEKNLATRPKSNVFLIATLAFDIIVFNILLFTSQEFGTIYGWLYFCLICSPRYLKLANTYYYFDSKRKRIVARPILKFHAAEHMVYNYYNKYQKIPTAEELKKSSRFSENCGTYRDLCELALYTIISIFFMITLPNLRFFIYLILAVIILVCYMKLSENGYLKFLEIAVTKKPTELELQCAIKGLEVFDELEKSIRKQKQENTGPIIIAGTGSEFVLECLTLAMDDFFGFFRKEDD